MASDLTDGTSAQGLDDARLARLLQRLPPPLGGRDPGQVVSTAVAAVPTDVAERLAWTEDAVRAVDLTTLEGTDTPSRVLGLCELALRPDPEDDSCPPVAAVCVYPDLVAVAVERLAGSSVAVASVAGAFPSGRSPLAVRLADTQAALDAGADEIDMVIDRGAFLDRRFAKVLDDVAQTRRLCDAHRSGVTLKVILETGELGGAVAVQRAGWLALLGGGDVLKTSTGKTSPAATPVAATLLLETAAAWTAATGAPVGVKAAGGIRSADDALGYLALARHLGAEVGPDRWRFGASSLLGALVEERRRLLFVLGGAAS